MRRRDEVESADRLGDLAAPGWDLLRQMASPRWLSVTYDGDAARFLRNRLNSACSVVDKGLSADL